MPGRHLNNAERRLARFWREPGPEFSQPLLKGITLEGPPALRGIQNIHAPLDYPITAICGKNGVGKSTLLALAAFSAARPDGWQRSPSVFPPVRASLRRMTFAWDEFFFRRPADPPLTGLTVRFDYTHRGDDLQFARVRTRNSRWANVPDPGRSRPSRFPKRTIDFLSLARIVSPAELRALRRRFSRTPKPKVRLLSESFISAMSYIMGERYESAGVHTSRGLPLAHCHTTAPYSGFDMGSGESSAITILSALERLPVGGLLLIEEIEHGFHPLAQERLVQELTRLVSRDKKQILCTTHSEYIIDSLPRSGRLLIERDLQGHTVTPSPTTRQSMYSMTGRPQPELTVYVEDEFAESVVKQALPDAYRTRVRIVPIGSSDRVVAQLATHLALPLEGPAICVLDGDCSDTQIGAWAQSSNLRSPELCFRLPGEGIPPERWVIASLLDEPYRSLLANQTRIDIDRLSATLNQLQPIRDHHNIPREFARRHALEEHAIAYILTSCVADHPDLQIIRDAVGSRLT